MTIDKKIRKYAKVRGFKQLGINYDTLTEAYNKANKAQKVEYEREMDQYFEAIEKKKIKKGQSILHTAYEGNTSQDNKSD